MKKEKNRTRAEKAADPRLGPAKTAPSRSSTATAAAEGPPGRVQWWHYAAALMLSSMTALWVYGPAIRGEFLFDDSYLPFLVPNIAEGPLRAWLGVRPFLMISYWLNYQSSGLDPYPYHLVNVLLHAANGVLVWMIVRRYLNWVDAKSELNSLLAVFAGLLFLLHPVQTESVAYVASRSETLSVFFVLAALAAFAYKGETIGWVRSLVVLLLFGAACVSKEHAVALAPLLLLTDWYFTTPFRFEGIRRNWRLYAPMLAGAGAAVLVVLWMLSSAQSAGFRIKEFTWYQYFFTQFRSVWLYLRLYLFPVDQNGDYDMAVSRTIFDQGAIFGLIGLAILAALAWRYRREYPLASFGFFGFLLLLAPTSSVVPIKDVAAERRLYLPFICLLLITVGFLRRWPYSRMALVGLIGGVSLAAGAATYQRNHVWSSALAFWEDTTQKSPKNSRAWFQLAYAQWHAGQCQQAVATYERVSTMRPVENDLLIDWAFALDCAARPDDAVAKLEQAAKSGPTAHIYATIGMIHGKRGRAQEALEALAAAEKLDPRFDMTYLYRGNVLLSTGKVQEAINEYGRALAINPRNDTARQALALAQQRLQTQAR
jgi:protein O-mannosyl-transferase